MILYDVYKSDRPKIIEQQNRISVNAKIVTITAVDDYSTPGQEEKHHINLCSVNYLKLINSDDTKQKIEFMLPFKNHNRAVSAYLKNTTVEIFLKKLKDLNFGRFRFFDTDGKIKEELYINFDEVVDVIGIEDVKKEKKTMNIEIYFKNGYMLRGLVTKQFFKWFSQTTFR